MFEHFNSISAGRAHDAGAQQSVSQSLQWINQLRK
jgi:hypothetical protein